jgi:hypothetical protein
MPNERVNTSKDTTLLYMFIPKNRASDYIKQNLTEIEKYEIIV